MKKTRFTDQQIPFALQQARAGTPVLEVCRKMSVSEPTVYRRKQKYGGVTPSTFGERRSVQLRLYCKQGLAHWEVPRLRPAKIACLSSWTRSGLRQPAAGHRLSGRSALWCSGLCVRVAGPRSLG